MSELKIIFGGARVNPNRGFDDEHALVEAFSTLKDFNVDVIDTSRAYGNSEAILGRANAGASFRIHTKVPGGLQPGSLSEKNIEESLMASFRELKVETVDTFYFHAPDASVPLDQALDAMDRLHKQGKFSNFGLANYLAHEVEEVHDYCCSRGYVLPSVYQGNFNPLARRAEDKLLPTLRRLGMSFHAYSPIAGGLLAKSRDQVLEGSGRFVEGSAYWKLYVNEANLQALGEWAKIAQDSQCHPAELAYRWMRYNSPLRGDLGDGLAVGANGVAQLRQTLNWLDSGPLDQTICDEIDQIWNRVKLSAPLDNFHG